LHQDPEISVIIPTLNEEKLIIQAVSQFTLQVRKKFRIEIIVSDGGSTDQTLELLKNENVTIVKAVPGIKQNIPQGRNAGSRAAKGKYFYFINADTALADTEKFFEVTLDALNDKNTAALTCRFHVFPEEVILSDRIFHGFYNNYVRLLNAVGMGMGRGECQIIRRDIFRELSGYNESLAAGEDYDLYRRAAKLGKGKIKFLNEITIYESPRRYRKFGYRRVFIDWTKNSVMVLFKNRSVSEIWEQVR
jgi:glycosyltransferase involved in cell wall biosynthesis